MCARKYKRAGVLGALAAGLVLLMGADGCEFKCESKEKDMVTWNVDETQHVAQVPADTSGKS